VSGDKDNVSLGFVSEYVGSSDVKVVPLQEKDTDREIPIVQRFWAYLPLERDQGSADKFAIKRPVRSLAKCLLSSEVARPKKGADQKDPLQKLSRAALDREAGWLGIADDSFVINDEAYEAASEGSGIRMIRAGEDRKLWEPNL
jgi:hypothetical protein